MKEELRNLSIQVAVLGERMDARFEQVDAHVDARFEQVDGQFDALSKAVSDLKQTIADNHVALVSMLLKR